MIAEYVSTLSTSPWHNDLCTIPLDYELPDTSYSPSLNFYNDSRLTSRGTSRRTSECSDREAELFCKDWYSDYAENIITSAQNYLPNEDYAGYESLDHVQDVESDSDGDSFNSESDEDDDEDCYPSPKKRQRNLQGIMWSEMSNEEHLSTIEELLRLISEKLNLRDQLEIIRIINPKAEVSPTDNEFTIELEWLTDEKLHKIRDYITQTSKLNQSESLRDNQDADEEDDDKDCSTETTMGKSRRSKRNARERREQMRVQRLRKRKENKQAVKEKKSGLFRNEKVLSVERCHEDCEEVDILG